MIIFNMVLSLSSAALITCLVLYVKVNEYKDGTAKKEKVSR